MNIETIVGLARLAGIKMSYPLESLCTFESLVMFAELIEEHTRDPDNFDKYMSRPNKRPLPPPEDID